MKGMNIKTVYLETSVLGSLAPGQPADRKRIVKQLLRQLQAKPGAAVISAVVLEEIEEAPPAVADSIRLALASVEPIIHPITDAVRALARAYLEAGILPDRRLADALHVAAATCHGNDYVVSWNHRHLTRPMKKTAVRSCQSPARLLENPFDLQPPGGS